MYYDSLTVQEGEDEEEMDDEGDEEGDEDEQEDEEEEEEMEGEEDGEGGDQVMEEEEEDSDEVVVIGMSLISGIISYSFSLLISFRCSIKIDTQSVISFYHVDIITLNIINLSEVVLSSNTILANCPYFGKFCFHFLFTSPTTGH